MYSQILITLVSMLAIHGHMLRNIDQAGSYRFAGKAESQVASPDTYVNFGQFQMPQTQVGGSYLKTCSGGYAAKSMAIKQKTGALPLENLASLYPGSAKFIRYLPTGFPYPLLATSGLMKEKLLFPEQIKYIESMKMDPLMKEQMLASAISGFDVSSALSTESKKGYFGESTPIMEAGTSLPLTEMSGIPFEMKDIPYDPVLRRGSVRTYCARLVFPERERLCRFYHKVNLPYDTKIGSPNLRFNVATVGNKNQMLKD